METIDDAATAGAHTGPQVGLRLVTTYDDTTRRIDLALRGSQGVLVEDGVSTQFPLQRLWPVLRDLLPPLDQLRADPPQRATTLGGPPGPGFVDDCRAYAVLATVVGDGTSSEQVSVRTWLATDDGLWSVTPGAEDQVRQAEPGALAELLVWDVTAAMETLVRALEAAS
jgi:hypothetical protein